MISQAPPWPAALGQSVQAIDTPSLVIDLDAMERNLARMAAFAREHGLRLRPHAKMHKCAALAQQQIAAGAVGVCVQKTAEAQVLAGRGIDDIYISNQVIAPDKLARVARLAQQLQARSGQLALAVDSLHCVQAVAQALAMHADASTRLDVFVEIDVGQGRCGVAPGADALTLARAVANQPQLRFAGLQAYQGRAQHLRSLAERRLAIAQASAAVQHTLQVLAQAGLPAPLVTGAGTGTFALEAASGLWGELQAGSYLFMDADYGRNEADPAQPQFEHALFVKSQVISRTATHAVCDAGHKSHALDSGLPLVHGAALEYANGGDEHGLLRGPVLPALGAAVWLVPGHCDPTVNLHAAMVGVRGGLEHGHVQALYSVDARGALT